MAWAVEGEWDCGCEDHGCGSCPVDGVEEGLGAWRERDVVRVVLGQSLVGAGGRRIAEEGDGVAQVRQLGGADQAVGEVLLEGGEVAAQRMGSEVEDEIAELLVREMGGHRDSFWEGLFWRARMEWRAR